MFEAAGFGSKTGFGARPALLIVDVNYDFVGDRPAPILESIADWPTSCGQVGWAAIDVVATLLGTARSNSLPIADHLHDRHAATSG